MESPQYSFEWVHGVPNFWALSDQQLAASCLRLARERVPGLRPFPGAEAVRLFLLWREALHAPGRTREEGEQKAGERAALRRRTIQVLVRLNVREPEQYSAASNWRV